MDYVTLLKAEKGGFRKPLQTGGKMDFAYMATVFLDRRVGNDVWTTDQSSEFQDGSTTFGRR